ncbi:MAG: CDGSH iron-sulfur domain-containing protein [Phycisphaerales bacterium]|nr:CDGSH iron-sulfur domain-containing protein [Phycisphaerales bacterium]
MARLVRREHSGPIKIDPKTLDPEKLISICACGLSKNFPFCDGAHKGCRSEQPGTLYVYDAQNQQVVETRPDQFPTATPPEPPNPQA